MVGAETGVSVVIVGATGGADVGCPAWRQLARGWTGGVVTHCGGGRGESRSIDDRRSELGRSEEGKGAARKLM